MNFKENNMNNTKNDYTVEELEARFEMETVIPSDASAETDGWYCRCGYEQD
jgi:hypothetical protein